MLRSIFTTAFLVASFALGTAACVEFSDYCSKKVDCEGGNDKDKAACADGAEGEEDAAKDYGCSKEFDDLDQCVQDHSVCQNSKFTVGTECSGQQTTLNTCIKNNTGKK